MSKKTLLNKCLGSLLYPIIILSFSLVLLFPLFSNQLLYSDDAELHAARVANYYLAVKQGQIPPRLAPNLDSGYGSPVLNFTYPLPYIISTLIFMALPVTVVMALNLTIILLTAIGVLGVYYLAKKFSLSSWHCMLVAILYLTAPYTFINIYSRTALGEIAFFAFLPWVMWGVEHFIKDKKVESIISLALVVNLALLLLSHQTSLIITFPILAIYYWLRMKNKKQTITNYLTQFPRHWSFFFHKITDLDRLNTFMMTTIGYSSWIVFLSSLWLVIKRRTANKKIIWYLLGAITLTTTLMMPFARPLWLISGLGNYFQYPWRLLFILTLCTVLLLIHLLQIKLFRNNHWLTGALVVTSILSTITYAHPRGFQNWSDYELFEYFKTTTTFNEFQPIWAAEYTRHFPEKKISLRIPGQKLYDDEILQPADYANLEIQNWNGSKMLYTIETNKPVEVIQKTYYFPGWKLIINEQPQKIQYQDEEFPGHITYSLEPGCWQVQLEFTQNTPTRKLGNYLTLTGILGLNFYCLSINKA